MDNRTIIEVAIDDCAMNASGVKDGFNSIVCEDGYRMTLDPVFDGDTNTGVDVIIDRKFIKRIPYSEKDFLKKIRRIFSDTAAEHNDGTFINC